MSDRCDPPKRSTAEWGLRVAFALFAATLGYSSVTFSLATVLMRTEPELAYALAPYDGRVAGAASAALSIPDASATQLRRSDALARRALRQDATVVEAAATLGVNADLRGQTDSARRLFSYAHKLSRRNLPTQIWTIEDAVQRGSISDALRAYDETLRVFPTMSKVLYPVLVTASVDPAVREGLVKILSSRPLWADSFFGFIALHSRDLHSTAMFFKRLHHVGILVPAIAQSELINALVASGNTDAAWMYYATVRPNTDRLQIRDSSFTAGLEAPSRLDWIPINDGGLTTSIASGAFDFAAPASVGGALLQQGQLLLPGIYQLRGHSVGIDQADGALPYWSLRCANGRELGRVGVSNSSQANGLFMGRFVVPMECPVQTLTLIAQPSDAIGGISGQLDQVELMPVRQTQ